MDREVNVINFNEGTLNINVEGNVKVSKAYNKEEKVLEDIPKVGDLCIFWDSTISIAIISTLKELRGNEVYPYLAGNGIM